MTDPKTVSLEGLWLIALKDLGLEVENVLRRARLARDLFSQEHPRLSVEDYFRFWNAVVREADDPLLPLTLVSRFSPEAFSPPVFAALCSPNMAVAASRMAVHKRLVAPMTMTVEEHEGGLFVGGAWLDPSVRSPESLAALELAFLTQIARIGTRELIRPVRVESHFAIEPTEAYREFFGVPVEKSDRHGLTLSLEDAKRPFLTANDSLWQTFEPELRRRLTNLGAAAPLMERVRSVLLETLPSGEATVGVAASRLGMSSRTLQRSLRQEGTSYKDVVRRTREGLARHYVTETKISYTEIGFLLGFAESSSFFRAFRDWTGETPDSLRVAARRRRTAGEAAEDHRPPG